MRKAILGPIEAKIREAVTKAAEEVSTEALKQQGYKLVDQLVERLVGDQIQAWAEKLNANIIDKLDGVDDIPDVE